MSGTPRLTSVAQQTEVGEGLAVGCLVVGVEALGAVDEALDVALHAALVAWPWATRYPTLVGARRPSLGSVMRSSTRRRSSHIAQWVVSAGLYVPQLRDDEWDLAAACERLEESTAVPARRWVSLASGFVDELADDLVRRHAPSTDDGRSPGCLDLTGEVAGPGHRDADGDGV